VSFDSAQSTYKAHRAACAELVEVSRDVPQDLFLTPTRFNINSAGFHPAQKNQENSSLFGVCFYLKS
jgi:hypothetical protein